MTGPDPDHPSSLPVALIGLTVVAGLVDAVSYLALGHVFTANMTGNVIFLAFAIGGVPGVSVTRSLVALAAFMLGALIGGRAVARPTSAEQLAAAKRVFVGEIALLLASAAAAIGYDGGAAAYESVQLYAIIVLTAVAMGMRTAAVRRLGVLDLTTTVLTLTIAGIAADSSLANGSNPRWQRRLCSIIALFAGAGLGAVLVRHSVTAALLGCAIVAMVSSLIARRR